jgi:hypothetical protein
MEVTMQVRHKLFKSMVKPWDSLCEEAGAFAAEIGRDRLINISVALDGGQGVIFVWYWE